MRKTTRPASSHRKSASGGADPRRFVLQRSWRLAPMPDARSLHLGLGSYGPGDYVIRPAPVITAEADACAMAELATTEGFTATTLLGAAANRDAVRRALRDATTLTAGSALLITMAGHGAQLPDVSPDPARPRPASARNLWVGDEDDGWDEAWCLYDGFMLDDELAGLLLDLAAGVRVLIVSDTCHSGTMLPTARRGAAATPIRASVLHLAACRDDGYAFNGDGHGLLTEAILRVWRGGFTGSHVGLRDAVAALTDPLQQPVLTRAGRLDVAFLAERPFTRPRRRLAARARTASTA